MRLKAITKRNFLTAGKFIKPLEYRKHLIACLFVLFSYSFFFASSPDAAKARFIRIIIVASRAEVDDLLSRIGKGESFAHLANEKSLDEKSRDRYGEIEAADLSRFESGLADCAAALKEGEVSGAIPLEENRYALVHVVDLNNYRRGSRAFRANDFKTAEENLLRHIELNPDAVKARLMLANIHETKKEFGSAESNYRNALLFDPKNEEAYLRLARLLSRKEEYPKAQEICEEGLKNIPDSKSLNTEVAKTKKTLAAAEKKSEAAKTSRIKEEKAASAKDSADLSAVAAREARKDDVKTEIASAGGPVAGPPKPENGAVDHQPAEKEKGEKTQTKPVQVKSEGKPVNIRIIITSGIEDAQKILSEIEKGVPFAILAKERSIDEKSREQHGYLGEVDSLSLNPSIQESISRLKEGQTSGIIALGDNRYALVQVTNSGVYREGERAFIEGDYKTAEKKLLAYVELNPDSAKARAMLGKIYEDKKEFSSAIDMYKKAISFSPKEVLVYERLARVYLYIGEYQKAKNVYAEGLRQVPSSTVLEEGIDMANILLIGREENNP